MKVVCLQIATTQQFPLVTTIDSALDGEVFRCLDGCHTDHAINDNALGGLDVKPVEDIAMYRYIAKKIDVADLEI